MRKFRKK